MREQDTMRPFTDQQPLVLLPIAGREVISYALKTLEGHISEWVIITPEKYISPLTTYMGEAFPGLDVTFSTKEELALDAGKYLVLQGNALYAPEDLVALAASETSTLLVKDEAKEGMTKVFLESGLVSLTAEDTEADPVFSTGACVLQLSDKSNFVSLETLLKGAMISEVQYVRGYFFQLLYPWNILEAQKYFLEKADIAYFVHPGAQIHATAYVGANVVIGAGVVVEEEAELQDVCLFPGVRIGAYSRIHGSVLADNVQVEPDTIVDGTSHSKAIVVSGKHKKVPSYSGVFVAPDMTLKGFYTDTSFIE